MVVSEEVRHGEVRNGRRDDLLFPVASLCREAEGRISIYNGTCVCTQQVLGKLADRGTASDAMMRGANSVGASADLSIHFPGLGSCRVIGIAEL